MCTFLAIPQLFFRTGNYLLCKGRDQPTASKLVSALRVRPVDAKEVETSTVRASATRTTTSSTAERSGKPSWSVWVQQHG